MSATKTPLDATAEQPAERPYWRRVQTFVRREGRTTVAQARALEERLPHCDWPAGCHHPDTVFGRSARCVLEIGFGAGENLLALCQAQSDTNFIGLEVHRPGVGQLLHRAHEANVNNLRVSSEDALIFLRERVPAGSLDQIQIWFPDPWHKKRHHKRRIIQAAHLDLMATALKPEGILLVATDWEEYAEWMDAELSAHDQFQNLAAPERFAPRCPDRVLTRFEKRGQRLGHAVFDFRYRRKA
nr:tRNA (guanosine(46)-N7)-methyltransferase TrmB [Oceanococcus sp. HetDA_MAG_MS8]